MSISHGPLNETLPEGPSNRSFGYTVGGILVLIALVKLWRSSEMTVFTGALALIGAVLVSLAFVAPSTLTGANRLWMQLGLVLFKIVNPVVMLLIYVTTFVPIGLYLRLRGNDALTAEFDKSAKTYWIDKPKGGAPEATMKNQF
ncbi:MULTISPECIES: hypothetical protein [unclassified Ensifer]|uniref:hypothetical protein n=1 Tax=unclassified Ensifer TaxID=2633371 RepID=UPI000812DD69|nr:MULTISPECIES: hypothetical protein [unclassified Ensifer]OCP05731.1 hypothetical protein BBX50_04385 [Ensifer sp. LC11]OCP06476.1 hypothetical protein BC374_04445 [Ensifer sp. LC13]OCP06798.1 hypothetical protein BC362_11720 [Ensifer sp. LC14]OCP31285.1 hypothetical protein BC364_05650 [Ensifer sp. LC499]